MQSEKRAALESKDVNVFPLFGIPVHAFSLYGVYCLEMDNLPPVASMCAGFLLHYLPDQFMDTGMQPVCGLNIN